MVQSFNNQLPYGNPSQIHKPLPALPVQAPQANNNASNIPSKASEAAMADEQIHLYH